jgi:hypothetical protein
LAEVSVLVITPADEALDYSVYESRLRSELLAAGFSIITERVPGRPDYASIAINAERSASQAALAINITEGELCGLLWIDDPAKSGGLMRPVRCCPLNDDAPLVFAVRATDALSAGLLELHYPQRVRETPTASPTEAPQGKPPKEQQAQPAPVVADNAEAHPKVVAGPEEPRRAVGSHRWHVQGAASVGAWLREFPVAYGGKLEVTRDLAESWAAGIQGLALAPTTVTRDAGQASIFQFLAGPVLQYRTRLTPGLSVVDALGAGLYGISIDATAAGPRGSRNVFSVTGYVLFEHQVHIEATRALSFVLGGALSAPWTRYSVVIVDATAARAAAPLVLGSLGAELSL